MSMHDETMKLLLVEDNPGDVRLVEELLQEIREATGEARFELESVDDLSAGLERVSAGGIDLILLDLHLPDSQGLDTVRRMCAEAPHVAVIVMTSVDSEEMGFEAVDIGAQEYLVKGRVDSQTLSLIMHYALDLKSAAEEVKAAREERDRFGKSDLGLRALGSMAMPIIIMDREGRITYFNRACEETTGYAAGEVSGKVAWGRLTATEDIEGFKGAFVRVVGGEGSEHQDGRWVSKLGEEIGITWDLSPVVDEMGAVEYVVGVGRVTGSS